MENSYDDHDELSSYTYSSHSYFDSYFQTVSQHSYSRHSSGSNHDQDQDTDESFSKPQSAQRMSTKGIVRKRVHVHSRWRIAKRSFLAGVLVGLPIYISFMYQNIQKLQQQHEIARGESFTDNQSYLVDPTNEQGVSSSDVQDVFESALNNKFRTPYEVRSNVVNIANEKAGATMINLYCPVQHSLGDSQGFFWGIFSNQDPSGDLKRCQHPRPLIMDGDTEWSYYKSLAIMHLEFGHSAKIVSFGLEFFKWDLRRQLQIRTQVTIYGCNHGNARHPWDNPEGGVLNYEEEKIAEFRLDDYDERVDHENKVRLYFWCKDTSCHKNYRGTKIQFTNEGTTEDPNTLTKLLVHERY